MAERTWWVVSGVVSALLIGLLLGLWWQKNQQEPDLTQLPNDQAVEAHLDACWPDPEYRIRTGIFIQSLKFFDSAEVHLTGYVWQHYQDGTHDDVKPSPGEAGFVLPEQVDSLGGVVREAYRQREAGGEVIGWYFEATLRQPFDYTDYPFDHKTVWVRLWPRDFHRDIVLVPDLAAYKRTGAQDVFGIEEEIVLDTWQRENTYFDYKPADYDTDFGIRAYVGQDGFPELHYNVVIKRKFENAFIVHMVPLFVVAALLFGALMTVTAQKGLAERHGYSTSNVIGTCSVLFFVVLLAHVHLREQFAGSGIVYMEYFYFMMYFLLLGVSVNTYLFSTRAAPWLRIVHYKDNLIPKAAFWPVLLACMVAITFLTMAETQKPENSICATNARAERPDVSLRTTTGPFHTARPVL